MTLSSQELKDIEGKLSSMLKQLAQDIIQAKKGSQAVTLDQQAVGRVSRVDAIQQQQMQAEVVRRMERKVLMCRNALKRMNDEFFGLCSLCEEPIDKKRLAISPESPLCLNCVRKSERPKNQ